MAYSFKEYLPFYKRNLRLAFPVMLTQLGGALVGVADSVMVGHYTTADLAAVSFANGIYFTLMVFAMGATMGITPLVGYKFVKSDDEGVRLLLRNGLVFAIVLALITCSLLMLCYPFMPQMGQENEVAILAQPYFITRVSSLLPFLFFCLFKQFLEGVGNTLAAMLISFGCNILNIGLNYLLIFGKLGFPEWGSYGAGVASLISTVLMPIIFLLVIWHRGEWRKYLTNWRSLNKIRWSDVMELVKIGFPIGGQTLLETVAFTLSFIMVGWINKESLAAHTTTNQIADLTFMLAMGIGAATTIRVSHQYGLNKLKSMRMAANASIHLVLVMNFIGASLMIGLRHYIPMLFTNDPIVREISSVLLIYAGLFQFSDGLQCVGASMLRGIADVKMPVIFAFISYILVALPVGYLLMFNAGLGVKGMWIGFVAGLFSAAVFFHIRFRYLVAKMPLEDAA